MASDKELNDVIGAIEREGNDPKIRWLALEQPDLRARALWQAALLLPPLGPVDSELRESETVLTPDEIADTPAGRLLAALWPRRGKQSH